MDSLTHIAIGACIGEAFFEKGFGKKAMWWGALAQSIPDIDFISSFWLTTSEALLAHRGFTHSLLFMVIIAPMMSFLAYNIHKPRNIYFYKWLIFFFLEVALHLFLDAFNNYGIGWLEPFSHDRFSFNVIYVADPFFSIPVGVAFFMLIFLDRHHPKRKKWWKSGLIISFVYLSYCCINKLTVFQEINKVFTSNKINHKKYFYTPAPLQNWLWYIVAEDSTGFNIGYYSVFDKSATIEFHHYPKNNILLYDISDHENLQRLIRFSQGFYTISKINDTLMFNDLRFGQINGWENYQNKFVFHYYLSHVNNEKLLIQKGRFSGFSVRALIALIDRALGNQPFLLK